MSQHDMDIANQLQAAFRSDLNNALGALVTLSSGATAPSTTFAYQLWADTTTGLLKMRNAANNAWISLLVMAGGTVGVGGATPSSSGAGISFPATQSASTDPNTFDDYEEGTWTPSLGGNTTYSTQVGTYTKKGREVTAHFSVAVTTLGTGSTSTLTGLPFSAAASPTAMSGMVSLWNSLAVNVLALSCYANATSVIFTSQTAAGGSNTNAPAIFGNGASIQGTVIYHV